MFKPIPPTQKDGYTVYWTANLEVCTVETDDGRSGQGWTEREALESAVNDEKHND